jgi:predicted DNA-binding protein (MmcQ/YjbR family)
MNLETIRQICRAFPAVTEDVKWGNDLCFCISGKMFAVVDLNPPHALAFKCTPETFGELIERPGVRPAPYMARNMWVLEEQLGEALGRDEVEQLVRTSYELVVAKMPKSRQPGASNPAKTGSRKKAQSRKRTAVASRKGSRQPNRTRAVKRRR